MASWPELPPNMDPKKPSPDEIEIARTIFEANRFVHNGQYLEAESLYSAILEDSNHPAAFLNRAVSYIGLGRPHLAVNDSLRAYMMSQHVLCETSSNDETLRLYRQISIYANQCHEQIKCKTPWTMASADMFGGAHKGHRLARMTLLNNFGTAKATKTKEEREEELLASPVRNMKVKALFRLTYALAKCGRGPAYTALGLLEGVFRLSKEFPARHGIEENDHVQLSAVAGTIQDDLLEGAIHAKLTDSDNLLTYSRFTIMPTKDYGFDERSPDCVDIDTAIHRLDPNAIVAFASTKGIQTLMATQDVFSGSVLFTESLPFVVSTANTCDPEDIDKRCDNCGADLLVPSQFVSLIKSEEKKRHEDARKPAKRGSTTPRDMEGIEVDEYIRQTPPSDPPQEAKKEDHLPPPTPVRGRQRLRPSVLETSDLQVCRVGDSKVRENFAYCSDECSDMANMTYHDSICGMHVENYLRTSIIQVEHPQIPTVQFQKLTLLLLLRILSWAHATSTSPLDMHVVHLLLASPRYGKLQDQYSVTWSFHNNVLRPIQMFQAFDGRTFSPKSATDVHNTDGRVLNSIISLVERHLYVSTEPRWEKIYCEEGYLEDTVIPRRDSHGKDPNLFFGRLHPLCDLVPVASKASEANVELVDLGDNRTVCIPLSPTAANEDEEVGAWIKEGTALVLLCAEPRRATLDERNTYARKCSDYNEGDAMIEVDEDEAEGDGYEEDAMGYMYDEDDGDSESEDEEMLDVDTSLHASPS